MRRQHSTISRSTLTRRGLLRRSLLAAGGLVGCAGEELSPAPIDDPVEPECDDPFAGGEPLGTVDFEDGGVPFHEKIGVGWDARLFFDLSLLAPDALVVDNDGFYVRTELPDQLDTTAPWTVRVSGLVDEDVTLSFDDITALVRPQGVHLLECSGNADGGSFGLMSAADWAGAPILELLESLPIAPAATRVLVSGFDGHSVPSKNGHSTPGASWIFTFDELADAFLATEMNGAPLPPDHGAPVRLLVPGWYGCSAIKWVDAIELVDEEVPATSQMREFASRTHQLGVPELARDFLPASIDQTAVPIRIEKWRLADGTIAYRIVGIMWGGQQVTEALAISFDGGVSREPVSVCPAQRTNATWTLWEHLWRPATRGIYSMRMAIDDPAIVTRRLDAGWYERSARIDDV